MFFDFDFAPPLQGTYSTTRQGLHALRGIRNIIRARAYSYELTNNEIPTPVAQIPRTRRTGSYSKRLTDLKQMLQLAT